jgi:sporulation protein YtfJ
MSINHFMKSSMESLRELVDVDTIVGKPIKVEGETIIPISKVSFGFGGGGSEFDSKYGDRDAANPFGGGMGGGFTITPIAFMIVGPRGVELKHLEERTHIYERLLEQVPKTLNHLVEEWEKNKK